MSASVSGNSVPTTTPPPGSTSGPNFFNSTGTSTAPTTTTGSPLISQDQSAFTQYVLGQTGGYAVTVGNLPGIPSGSTTVGQVLQDFMDLPPAELQQIEMQLFDAGYYMNADGSKMNSQDINFGIPGDPASWTALARALSEAAGSGTALTTLLTQRAQSGAGANNTLPQAVTGGGNTYTIDLANPEAVRYTADQIFQAALGRNASASEIQAITGNLRSQETQQGLAQQAGAEQQSKARYQAGITQRNISYETQTNPNLGGAVPQGPFNSPSDWAAALLGYMNLQVTTSNVALITALVNKIGGFGNGSYNPLGTQRPEGGSTAGAGGVQQFQNWQQGLQATASMLMNGKYQSLVSALQNGNASGALQTDPGLAQDIKVWTGGKFSTVTVDQSTTQAAAQSVANYQPPQPQGATGVPAGGKLASLGLAPNQPAPSGLTPGAPFGSNLASGGGGSPADFRMADQSASASANNAANTTNPADVNLGQQPPNPGDAYINPVTVYDVSPADASSAAYQAATTGANRPEYLGNQYLQLLQAMQSANANAPKAAG